MKYRVEKTIEVAGAHQLNLDYESPCRNMHGHNWMITVCCEAEELDRHGMVVDFSLLRMAVMKLDHSILGASADLPNTTAESIGAWVMHQVDDLLHAKVSRSKAQGARPGKCVEVRVRESRDNLCVVTS
ncbi:MAG TPA: 6-carboxytetrahydropterin synthase [Chloroflexi bacterium]|nr:6-carboxytetrahydropterin synthase [Chloroflexota bacterium]